MRIAFLFFVLSTGFSTGVAAAQTSTPQDLARAFAESWAQPEADELLPLLHPDGVMLSLARIRERMGRSRALAALDEVRADRVGANVSIVRVEEVGGDPRKAFTELHWESVLEGTSEPMRRTVYVGFVHDDGGWWVQEIRILG